MNVHGIQIAQGQLGAAGEKINSGKGIASAQSDVVPQATYLPEAKENKISPDKSSSLGNAIDIYYPPFFPMGKTQEIFAVMSEDTSNINRSPSDTAQTLNRVMKEMADTGQQQIVIDKTGSVKENEPQEAVGSGRVLDLKV